MPPHGGQLSKALLVGMDYPGERAEQRSCVNGVLTMLRLLQGQPGLCDDTTQLRVLADAPCDLPRGLQAELPTREAILSSLRWLSEGCAPGDAVFFYFAGCGRRVRGDPSGLRVAICPSDVRISGKIEDREIFEAAAAPLPSGARLTAMMDCSFSGAAMSLPYEFAADDTTIAAALASPQHAMHPSKKQAVSCPAEVVLLSSCGGAESSLASRKGHELFGLEPHRRPHGGWGSVFTSAVAALLGQQQQTPLRLIDVIRRTRESLVQHGFDQTPQLSASRSVDLGCVFGFAGDLVPGATPRAPEARALFVGINYKGVPNCELRSCVNDVRTMRRAVNQEAFPGMRFTERVLADDPQGFPGAVHPTREAVLEAFAWLVDGCSPGDALFFFYSGSGHRVRDRDGDEGDGYDEAICPVDFITTSPITDDEMFSVLVAPLPQGVRLTAVMDCANCGTALDLPFEFEGTDESLDAAVQSAKQPMRTAQRQKRTQGDVLLISSCSDAGTSRSTKDAAVKFGLPSPEASAPGAWGSVFTNALARVLLDSLQSTPPARLADVLHTARQAIRQHGYPQVPQLSASKAVDLGQGFRLAGPLAPALVDPKPAVSAPKVKALFVGINYEGSDMEREHCVPSAKAMRGFITKHAFSGRQYKERVLMDADAPQGALLPTRENILKGFDWLVDGAQPKDTFVFYFSGLGHQQDDFDGDEEDGKDESLTPCDYDGTAVQRITDDEIFERLVRRLPTGTRLTAIIDCGHSGTALDLPYEFSASQRALASAKRHPKTQMTLARIGKRCTADVLLLSSCHDAHGGLSISNVQHHFGLPGPQTWGGVATFALIAVLSRAPPNSLSFIELLQHIRRALTEKHDVVQQISASKPLDLGGHFSFFGRLPRGAADASHHNLSRSMGLLPPGPQARALLIGIDYGHSEGGVRGTHDLQRVADFLRSHGFPLPEGAATPNEHLRILTDDADYGKACRLPTRQEILAGLDWLVEGARAGDTLFLYYRGSGASVKDTTGDETDGMDEALVPVDHKASGVIMDDDVFERLVEPLPKGVRLTAVTDASHCGTVLDLPWEMHVTDAALQGDARGTPLVPNSRRRRCAADVLHFASSSDAEPSCSARREVQGVTKLCGVFTTAFIAALQSPTAQHTAFSLLRTIRAGMAQDGAAQIPQLSASMPLDTGHPFSLFGPLVCAPSRPPVTLATRRVKALLVGIGGAGQHGGAASAAPGMAACGVRVKAMLNLVRRRAFPGDRYEERLLSDAPGSEHPSAANIRKGLEWLAGGASAGDTLFFYFGGRSGGGGGGIAAAPEGGDEEEIPADELHSLLLQPLPRGVRLTAVMDCAPCGAALGLPWELRPGEAGLEAALRTPGCALQPAAEAAAACDADAVLLSAGPATPGHPAQPHADPDTADPPGAFTLAVAAALLDASLDAPPYVDVLLRINEALRDAGCDTTPCLSASRPLDLSSRVSLVGPLVPQPTAATASTPPCGDRTAPPISCPAPVVRAVLIGANFDHRGFARRLEVEEAQGIIRQRGLARANYAERVLTDDALLLQKQGDGCADGSALPPSRANILAALGWLAEGAAPGDTLVLYYAGESVSTDGKIGDSSALHPGLAASDGVVTSAEVADTLVAPLPRGVRLTVVVDASRGAAALRLPWHLRAPPAASEGLDGVRMTGEGAAAPCRADVLLLAACGRLGLARVAPAPAGVYRSEFTRALAGVLLHTAPDSLRISDVLRGAAVGDTLPHVAASVPLDLACPFSFFGPLVVAPQPQPGGAPAARVKALLVGVDQCQEQGFPGCASSVKAMQNLVRRCAGGGGMALEERLLIDSPHFLNAGHPSAANIRKGLEWLAGGASAGDTLFFYFGGRSGGGGDGAIATAPEDGGGGGDGEEIPADELHSLLLQPLPRGVRLTAVMDCAPCGAALGLPWELRPGEAGLEAALRTPGCALQPAAEAAAACDADTVLLSAGPGPSTCGQASGGAFTLAVAAALLDTSLDTSKPLSKVLSDVHDALKQQQGVQAPLLSASKQLDLASPFCLAGAFSNAEP